MPLAGFVCCALGVLLYIMAPQFGSMAHAHINDTLQVACCLLEWCQVHVRLLYVLMPGLGAGLFGGTKGTAFGN